MGALRERRRIRTRAHDILLIYTFFSLYYYQSSFAGGENPIAVTVGGMNAHCCPKRNSNDSHISSGICPRDVCCIAESTYIYNIIHAYAYIYIIYICVGEWVYTHTHSSTNDSLLEMDVYYVFLEMSWNTYLIYAAEWYPGLVNSTACWKYTYYY